MDIIKLQKNLRMRLFPSLYALSLCSLRDVISRRACINQRVLKLTTSMVFMTSVKASLISFSSTSIGSDSFFVKDKLGSIPPIDIHGSFKISEALGRLRMSLCSNLPKNVFNPVETTGAFSKLNSKGFV